MKHWQSCTKIIVDFNRNDYPFLYLKDTPCPFCKTTLDCWASFTGCINKCRYGIYLYRRDLSNIIHTITYKDWKILRHLNSGEMCLAVCRHGINDKKFYISDMRIDLAELLNKIDFRDKLKF